MFEGNQTEHWSAAELRYHLTELHVERALAMLVGLGNNVAYIEDLEDELEAAQHAYVGVAVTEIATLRGELGRQLG